MIDPLHSLLNPIQLDFKVHNIRKAVVQIIHHSTFKEGCYFTFEVLNQNTHIVFIGHFIKYLHRSTVLITIFNFITPPFWETDIGHILYCAQSKFLSFCKQFHVTLIEYHTSNTHQYHLIQILIRHNLLDFQPILSHVDQMLRPVLPRPTSPVDITTTTTTTVSNQAA